MTDLDDILGKLGVAPVPHRLAGIDDAIFTGLARHRAAASATSGRVMSLAAAVALGIGIAGATLPGTPARAAPALSPFGTAAALAPSSLLSGSE